MAAETPRGTEEKGMATVVAPTGVERNAADTFVIQVLEESQRAYSLGEVVSRAATSSHHLSAEDIRAAAAALVEAGRIRLTDDLRLRLVRKNK